MRRREVLKLLVTGSVLPTLSPPLLAACREIHEAITESKSLKALSVHQHATLIAMAELILPRTDTPGAKDTNVNLFIDRILADWCTIAERDRFLTGLADVDRRAQSLFQKNFVDSSVAQQTEILRGLGEELAEAVAAVASGARGNRGSTPEPQDNFYLQFRKLTLTGYFTSEPGFTQQLGQEIVPGRFDSCAPVRSAVQTKGS
ncbi:MAG TPA: gluconate 2-dehydrogenase subunit 3 family protein [Dongiaceae bacterium]|nr:gluconate 2-dehydrogenase subunit 3 family protein [Dongiaceae bacterium]